MRAILQLLIVFGIMSFLSSNMHYSIEQPNVSMHSTSAMTSCGSTLPCAASTGFVSADDNLAGSTNYIPSGPRRIGGNMNQGDGPDNPDDPWKTQTPVGDLPWGMMLVFLVIYLVVSPRPEKKQKV